MSAPENPRKSKKGRASEGDDIEEKGNDEEELRYEDPFSDEEEDEDMVEGEGEGGMDVEEAEDEDDDDEEDEKAPRPVYVPSSGLGEGEELVVDNSSYEMLHRLTVEWPILSFDFIHDTLGQHRTKFPLTCYAVGGTEADEVKNNKLVLMRMTQLHRTKHDDGDSSTEEENEEDLDDDAELQHVSIRHHGCVNRVRCMPQEPGVVASWSETGKVHVWDLSAPLRQLERQGSPAPNHACEPVFSCTGHSTEGFAMDWSPLEAGRLLTGDNSAAILKWSRAPGAQWVVDSGAFAGHEGSVEDLQWSPTELEVFASCSSDKTVRIWDARKKQGSALSVVAATADVNVISWNSKVTYLLAAGDDSGTFKVWDLRSFGSGQPVASFSWHTKPISSIQWNPEQPSMIATACSDDQVTLWDLSLEKDSEAEAQMQAEGGAPLELPPQLIFIHQGQRDVKEIRWHPQCPGVVGSTAGDGFNVFKTINSG